MDIWANMCVNLARNSWVSEGKQSVMETWILSMGGMEFNVVLHYSGGGISVNPDLCM